MKRYIPLLLICKALHADVSTNIRKELETLRGKINTNLPQVLSATQKKDLAYILEQLNAKDLNEGVKKIDALKTPKPSAPAKPATPPAKQDPYLDQLLVKLNAKNIKEATKNLDGLLDTTNAKNIAEATKTVKSLKSNRPLPPVPAQKPRSDEQLTADAQLVDVLEQYNPDTISEDQKNDLINKLREAVEGQRNKKLPRNNPS